MFTKAIKGISISIVYKQVRVILVAIFYVRKKVHVQNIQSMALHPITDFPFFLFYLIFLGQTRR